MHQALFYLASSFWAGVVHAATPGHGKTIAAAYIVGARGKPVDAVILGIFVTLSHVSGIVIVGVLASLGSSWLVPARTEAVLALAMAILVLGLGLWMLWTQRALIAAAFPKPTQRMMHAHTHHSLHAHAGADHHHHDAGVDHAYHTHAHTNADNAQHVHVHAGAGYHEHGHDHMPYHDHDHDHVQNHDHEHVHDRGEGSEQSPGDSEGVVWHSHGWGTKHAHRLDLVTGDRPRLSVLITLSIAGGILPDPAALAILLAALSTGRVVLGLVTVLVFSLGFALTLVAVGIVAAQIGQRVLSWLDSVWSLRLQLATTLLIIGMGAWLTVQAVRQFAPALSL
jgi:nickel/cobalt transporter (NicO) family protein